MRSARGRRVVIALCILMSLLSGGAALTAQTTEPETSSGAAVAEPAPDWDAYAARAEGFRTAMLQSRNTLEDARRTQETLSANMRDNRADCQASLRRANRDTRFRVLLGCYERELEMLHGMIEAEQAEFTAMPGGDALLRTLVADRLSLLLDALGTVREAVDAGVFVSEEDLLEAKGNLWTRYREPYAVTAMRLRADAFRTWVAHIQLRIRDFRDAAEEDPGVDGLMECWAGIDRDLAAMAALQEYADLADGLRQAGSAARKCIDAAPAA